MAAPPPYTQAETLTIANIAGAILSGVIVVEGFAASEGRVAEAVRLAVKVFLEARKLAIPRS